MNKCRVILATFIFALLGCQSDHSSQGTLQSGAETESRSLRYSKQMLDQNRHAQGDYRLINGDRTHDSARYGGVRVMSSGYKNYLRIYQSPLYTSVDYSFGSYEPGQLTTQRFGPQFPVPSSAWFGVNGNVYSVPVAEIKKISETAARSRPYFELGFNDTHAILLDVMNNVIVEVPVESIANTRFFQFVYNSELFSVLELLRFAPETRISILNKRPRVSLRILNEPMKRIELVRAVLVSKNCVVVAEPCDGIPDVSRGSCFMLSRIDSSKIRELSPDDGGYPVYSLQSIKTLMVALRVAD